MTCRRSRATRQLAGTSIASVVTFLLSRARCRALLGLLRAADRGLAAGDGGCPAGRLIRSKIVPRLTAKPSRALADEHAWRRAGCSRGCRRRRRTACVSRRSRGGARRRRSRPASNVDRVPPEASVPRRRAGAAVAADDVDRVGLDHVQVASAPARVTPPRLSERDRARPSSSAGPIGRVRPRAVERIVEVELEGDVLAAVAVVVDVDLVERVGIQGEVVRTAVRVLQRQVVREERDVARAAGLVAVEHVEVGAVDLRVLGDERRLAVARRVRRQAGESVQCTDGGHDRQQAGAMRLNGFHVNSSLLGHGYREPSNPVLPPDFSLQANRLLPVYAALSQSDAHGAKGNSA